MVSRLACAYSVTAIGSQSPASLAARLAAVPVDFLLPDTYGLLLISDVSATVSAKTTRTMTFLFDPGEGAPSASVVLEPGEVGAPIQSVAVTSSGDGMAARPIVTFSAAIHAGRRALAYPTMKVTSGVVVHGGTGFTSGTVVFVGGALAPGGVEATGHLTFGGGAVTGLVVDSGGGPYNEPPNAVIFGNGTGALVIPALGVSGLQLVDPGSGWQGEVTVVFTPLYYSVCGGGDYISPMRNWMTGQLQNALKTTVVALEPVVS